MIYQNSVTNAIYTILSSDTIVTDINPQIRVNGLLNQDPNLTPWIGIYSAPVLVEPIRSQRPNPWVITFRPQIYVQGYNRSFYGHNTYNDLDNTTNRVTLALDTAFATDRTLMGTVDIINEVTLDTYNLDLDNSSQIMTYVITINAERRHTV